MSCLFSLKSLDQARKVSGHVFVLGVTSPYRYWLVLRFLLIWFWNWFDTVVLFVFHFIVFSSRIVNKNHFVSNISCPFVQHMDYIPTDVIHDAMVPNIIQLFNECGCNRQIVWSISSTPIKWLFYFLIKQKQGSGHDLNIFMHIYTCIVEKLMKMIYLLN